MKEQPDKILVDGVCCQYCAHFETENCPIKTADPWGRWTSFCCSYKRNSKFRDAKALVVSSK